MNPAHLDYDTLADLAEGLLEDDQAASVSAHLDTCAECRERSADLADVSRILAEAPVPSLPPDLAERIDTAIAAESLETATVVSLEQRRGRRHWRILSAAAATVVVLGGGAVAGKVALDGSDDAGHRHSANTPAMDGTRSTVTRSGPGTAAGAAPSGEVPTSEGLRSAGYAVSHSGTDYRTGTLGRQVDRLLGKGAELKVQGAPPDGRLAGCVSAVTRGKAPGLVDEARFEGRQATVIAVQSGRPGTWDVWVVGPDCTAQNPHVLKQEQAAS
ncbi:MULTISPECIES: anti-sigma factor family protein [Actinomadura]|uniref:Anti-sigma factor family protein n=1 Tax=Actinomadura yumaensis TaxID=111807 RepID=A0ABW2CQS5_9ACTN|nr:DUF3379 domain-containing protein [Actinomadura sp. J1-007]MWK35266.1 hypothetical protein [Actinomadura sp. J1-007]